MRGRGALFAAVIAVAFSIATGVAGAAATLFQPYHAVDVGSWPEAVAVGDVTGDGRRDVVMTTGYYFDPASDFRVWVFAQTESGALAAPTSLATGSTRTPESVAIGDVTGDARADIVVGLDEIGLQVYPQSTTGTLGSPTFYPTPDGNIVRLGHLNGDDRLDVAAIGWGTNTVSVLLSDGAGGLQPPIVYPARHAGYDDLEVGDVTGDGRDDLVVMSGQTYAIPNLSVLAQLDSGGFGPAAEYRVAENVNTNGVGIGELTGDDRKDVVVSFGGNRPSSNIAVFPQTAAGMLGAPVVRASHDIPEPVEVADLDVDGRVDVVTLHGGWNRAGVYLQHLAGGFASEDLYAIPYASHYGPSGLAVGDVSGDGRPDLAIADYNQGLVVLYSDAPPPPPPPPRADVSVDVTASAARVKPKKGFWFDLVVRNAGPDSTAASMTVRIDGDPSALVANDSRCSVQGATAFCSFPGLAVGSSATVRLSGTAPVKGTLTATASVDGVADDPSPGNDTDSASILVR